MSNDSTSTDAAKEPRNTETAIASVLQIFASSIADTVKPSDALKHLNLLIKSLLTSKDLSLNLKSTLVNRIIKAHLAESKGARKGKMTAYTLSLCSALLLAIISAWSTIWIVKLQKENSEASAREKIALAKVTSLNSEIDTLNKDRTAAENETIKAREAKELAKTEAAKERGIADETRRDKEAVGSQLAALRADHAILLDRSMKWVCVIDSNRNESGSVMRKISDRIRATAEVKPSKIIVDQEPVPLPSQDIARADFGKDIQYINRRHPDAIVVHWHALRGNASQTEAAEEALLTQLSILWQKNQQIKPPHVFIYSREEPFTKEIFLRELNAKVGPDKARAMNADFTVIPFSKDARMLELNIEDLAQQVVEYLDPQ